MTGADTGWTWRTTVVVAVAAVLLAAVLLRAALHPLGRLVVLATLLAAGGGFVVLLVRPAAYPRARVGVGTRVTTARIAEGEPDPGTCVDCGDEAAGGLRRRFVREAVVAGVPLVLLDDGENRYCPACVPEEWSDEVDAAATATSGRHPDVDTR
jgi:hypothetical protein